MSLTTFDIQYNNVRQALGSAQEPSSDGVLYIQPATFAPLNRPYTFNRWTFQFVEGDGGTLSIFVQGPAGTWGLYTNSSGQVAQNIGVNDVYIMDTGNWTAIQCAFAGTDGSAVLSVLAWTAEEVYPTLSAEVAALQTQVAELEAVSSNYALIPLQAKSSTALDFIAAPFESGAVTSILYTAAGAFVAATGALTIALYNASDDSLLGGPISIDGETSVEVAVSAASFTDGFYAKVNATGNVTQGNGAALHVQYTRTV
jgi:hypothetical protein